MPAVNTMRAILCAIAVLCIPIVHAVEDDWIKIASTTGKTQLTEYIRAGSVTHVRQSIFRAWFKRHFELSQPLVSDPTKFYTETRFLAHIDCVDRSVSYTSMTHYSADGTVVYSQSSPYDSKDFKIAIPETLGESEVTVVCAVGKSLTSEPSP